MGIVTKIFHDKVVYSRRMTRLKEILSPMLEESAEILDLGCGDGKIDSYILEERKDIKIKGIDVLVRPDTYIDVMEYDGKTIPYEDNSFDTVMTIDVLHHTDNPMEIVKEMTRVSSKYIVIKDHIKTGFISYLKLRAMDYVGNAHYHVRLPYNYLTQKQWNEIFEANGLGVKEINYNLNLYKGLFHLLFDRKLHFTVKLQKNDSQKKDTCIENGGAEPN